MQGRKDEKHKQRLVVDRSTSNGRENAHTLSDHMTSTGCGSVASNFLCGGSLKSAPTNEAMGKCKKWLPEAVRITVLSSIYLSLSVLTLSKLSVPHLCSCYHQPGQ